jgi:Holliday junction resolvasome RuvABC DNA-binding subunit
MSAACAVLLGAHLRRCRHTAGRRRYAIETYVREDQIKLFGFHGCRARVVPPQTVQGVGAKVALSVLGTLKPADLASAIALRDKAMVARSPGVGPKVAERIVTELKDKAPAYADVDPAVIRLSGAVEDKRAPQPVADAVSALINLGYGQPQAAAAIAAATRNAGEGRYRAADPAGLRAGEMSRAIRPMLSARDGADRGPRGDQAALSLTGRRSGGFHRPAAFPGVLDAISPHGGRQAFAAGGLAATGIERSWRCAIPSPPSDQCAVVSRGSCRELIGTRPNPASRPPRSGWVAGDRKSTAAAHAVREDD